MSDGKGNQLEIGDLVVIRARVVTPMGASTVGVRVVRPDGTPGDPHTLRLSEVEREEGGHGD